MMAVHNSFVASDRFTENTRGVQTQMACRMKHVELKVLAVQEWLKTGLLRLHKVSTHVNPADLMTEAMTREKQIKFGRASNMQ